MLHRSSTGRRASYLCARACARVCVCVCVCVWQKLAGTWEHRTEDIQLDFQKEGDEMLVKYQNPLEADKLLKVQSDLDEVKDVMLKNIDELLQRGEKLENLMERSEDLSQTSHQFYRTAKKNNQCCSWY
eukprot:GHVU01147601.1.p2 GENE.GHVU01147601.1~~GHVU01147601.1.p2  ORF type:complete len:129 (-),score=20.35 GHVU01147601.1:830-1216(-)